MNKVRERQASETVQADGPPETTVQGLQNLLLGLFAGANQRQEKESAASSSIPMLPQKLTGLEFC